MKRQRPARTRGPVLLPVRLIARLLNVRPGKVRDAVKLINEALRDCG